MGVFLTQCGSILMIWQFFCTLLCERFPGPTPTPDDSLEQCQVLKEINTMENYIDQSEGWMTRPQLFS
jgi:hypothetical protein